MKRAIVSCVAAMLVLGGCAQKAAEPESTRVENPEIGIALASLPKPFEVAVNSGERLRLTASGAGGVGVLEIIALPTQAHGVNLHEAVNDQEEQIQRMADGKFFGFQELMGPLGTAFTSRGTFTGEGGPVEVIRVFMVHPMGSRRLDLVYTYPPGEGQVRAQQVLEVLAEVEALYPPTS